MRPSQTILGKHPLKASFGQIRRNPLSDGFILSLRFNFSSERAVELKTNQARSSFFPPTAASRTTK